MEMVLLGAEMLIKCHEQGLNQQKKNDEMIYHRHLTTFTRCILVVSETLRHYTVNFEATPQEHPRFTVLCFRGISINIRNENVCPT